MASAKICLKDPRAVFPSKAHPSDIGFDLTLVDIWKTDGDVTFYETGVAVEPSLGHYFEVVPRSSLSKSGYMIANSIGVIDPEYRGTIKVALIKVQKDKPDLELPIKACQLVTRYVINTYLKQVESLDSTVRGAGGFGSTDQTRK